MKLKSFLTLFVFLTSCSYVEYVPKPVPAPANAGPEISGSLLALLTLQEQQEILGDSFPSKSLDVLNVLGTPAGYRLKLRYSELGSSLVEALKLSRDDGMIQRLLDLAQYSSRNKVRAEALITLAQFSDPKDLVHFQTALSDRDTNIKLAAIEALQSWGHPSGLPLLRDSSRDNWTPLMRVLSAQALLSLGDESGMAVLKAGLRDGSWLIRAMSARYIGDYGKGSDYEEVFKAFERETRNDFVVVELAIATLKLLSKKGAQVIYAPALKGWSENTEVKYSLGKDAVVELEPLVILPPRLFIPESEQISASINRRLLTIIQKPFQASLSDADKNDPNLQDLNTMLTPAGYNLQTRYSELNYLLVESLAGTKNNLLRYELIRFAEANSNSVVQASSLISLAYSQLEEDLILITNALNSEDPIVRFGAMEAVMIGQFKQALPSITNIAYGDTVPAFRVFAMQLMAGFGEPVALDLLLQNLENPDWPARAMAFWYLGRYGREGDFATIFNKINIEKNPFVLTDISLSAIRLSPLDN